MNQNSRIKYADERHSNLAKATCTLDLWLPLLPFQSHRFRNLNVKAASFEATTIRRMLPPFSKGTSTTIYIGQCIRTNTGAAASLIGFAMAVLQVKPLIQVFEAPTRLASSASRKKHRLGTARRYHLSSMQYCTAPQDSPIFPSSSSYQLPRTTPSSPLACQLP